MGKEIIVNANMAEEVRIAIKENRKLLDLDFENQSRTKHKGNIYKGIITNIEDSLEAAFIEIGEERQAFLARSEIRPSLIPSDIKDPRKAKVSDIFKRGQEIVVQVTKDEIGNKGAAVSTYLSLPGRYIVLMHSDECGGGISRKINDESSRRAAREMLDRLEVPDGMAVIIRTAGMEAAEQDLLRDFAALCENWQQIDKGAQLGRAPTLLYREPDIVIRTIRDYFSTDVDKIVIDDEEEFNDALSYFKERMPDLSKILFRHKKKEPIFQHFQIEQEIEQLFDPEVKLPSGGYIVIEQTEALVSIDVNSGKSNKEEDHEATVYKTNMEAADEIARQLRLRDMGGIVVVDFIDMVSHRHRREVENKIKHVLYGDKARTKVSRISENGTLELTRQRIRQSHSLVSLAKCPTCAGTGRVRDLEGLAGLALRKISGHLTKKRTQLSKLSVSVPVGVANILNNQKRNELVQLSENHTLFLEILGDASLQDSSINIKEEKRGQAGLDAASKKLAPQQKGRKPKNRIDVPSANFPPPSIGPIPTLVDVEDMMREEVELNEPKEIDPRLTLEDPIFKALFGDVEVEMPVSEKKSRKKSGSRAEKISDEKELETESEQKPESKEIAEETNDLQSDSQPEEETFSAIGNTYVQEDEFVDDIDPSKIQPDQMFPIGNSIDDPNGNSFNQPNKRRSGRYGQQQKRGTQNRKRRGSYRPRQAQKDVK